MALAGTNNNAICTPEIIFSICPTQVPTENSHEESMANSHKEAGAKQHSSPFNPETCALANLAGAALDLYDSAFLAIKLQYKCHREWSLRSTLNYPLNADVMIKMHFTFLSNPSFLCKSLRLLFHFYIWDWEFFKEPHSFPFYLWVHVRHSLSVFPLVFCFRMWLICKHKLPLLKYS